MIDKWLERYKKLKQRERMLVIVFTAVIAGTLYFHFLYKPLSRVIATYKFQTKKLALRLNELEKKTPQAEAREREIEDLRAENGTMLKRITEIEKKLPSKRNTTQLIGEFTRLAENLKLISIRQKLDTGDEYSRIMIELKFNGLYGDIVGYINSLETISLFLSIDEMEISQPGKKSKVPGMPTRLVVSSLLGDMPFAEELRAKEQKEALPIVRDIFVSKSKPVVLPDKTDLKLEGITYNAESPTAIINNKVVRLGAKVGDLEIRKICPDAVILTDGLQDHILSVER
ncbi:MAG: type 4a pilus biogenesis protein PilO [Candidatus Omnitrophica bacterium]|nr:type 4a pilus biogenesis protein PilO [Candidatus Omnitrophota bacterium]